MKDFGRGLRQFSRSLFKGGLLSVSLIVSVPFLAIADTPPAATVQPAMNISLDALNANRCGPVAAVEVSSEVESLLPPDQSADLDRLIEYLDRPTPLSGWHPRDLPGIAKLEPESELPLGHLAKGHCAATRIARDWFITAAHCVDEDYDRLVLKVGSDHLSSSAIREVRVDYAICHGGYRAVWNRYANDLALLRILDDDLSLLEGVPVIAWGMTSRPFSPNAYPEARVGGWGLITYGGELSDTLQKMELDIFEVGPALIRINSRYGRGPCVGDSGGPLIVEDDGEPVLMGVLSTVGSNRYGEHCAGNYFASYTNLEGFRMWVINTMTACREHDWACRQAG